MPIYKYQESTAASMAWNRVVLVQWFLITSHIRHKTKAGRGTGTAHGLSVDFCWGWQWQPFEHIPISQPRAVGSVQAVGVAQLCDCM